MPGYTVGEIILHLIATTREFDHVVDRFGVTTQGTADRVAAWTRVLNDGLGLNDGSLDETHGMTIDELLAPDDPPPDHRNGQRSAREISPVVIDE